MKTYLVTDTHWNHSKINEFENRPKNWEKKLKHNWNNLVSKNDLVIHLGDVIFNRQSELKEILESLNGRKILIKGNHDNKSDNWYLNNGFSLVFDFLEMNDILYSHEPMMSAVSRCSFNIHGHFHTNSIHNEKDYLFYSKNFNKCLEIETTLSPVSIEDFFKGKNCLW